MRIAITILVSIAAISCSSDSTTEKSWGQVQSISLPGGSVGNPRIAVDGLGNSFVVWRTVDGNTVRADVNRYSKSTGWQGALTLDSRSNPFGSTPGIGASQDGSAIVLFGVYIGPDDGSLLASRFVDGAGWSDPQTVTAIGLRHLPSRPVLDASGAAFAVWVQLDFDGSGPAIGNLYASTFAPDVGWGSGELLEELPTSLVGERNIAVDSDGNAIVVWAQMHDDGNERIFANRYTNGQSWGTAQQISSLSQSANHPQVAIDSSGNALVVWRQRTDSGTDLYANDYNEDSGWTGDYRLGPGGGLTARPRLAVGNDDSFYTVWTRLDNGESTGVPERNILATSRAHGQNWTEPTTIDVLDGVASNPGVAALSDGALVVWVQDDSESDKVFASRFRKLVGWDGPQLLNPGVDPSLDALQPEVDVDSQGDASAVWVQDEGSSVAIYTARYE